MKKSIGICFSAIQIQEGCNMSNWSFDDEDTTEVVEEETLEEYLEEEDFEEEYFEEEYSEEEEEEVEITEELFPNNGELYSSQDEYMNSVDNDGRMSTTMLDDILSGVNGGAFDYDFQEPTEEDLADGSEIGFKGTVINRSHKVTSLRKCGAVGVRAETKKSKELRLSYIYDYKEDGTPIYNFNEGGKILDMEEVAKKEFVIKKETEHMGTLYFKECTKEEARDMIICGHYSHKFQGYFGKINVGVYTQGRLVGVASYGGLMNPKSYKNFGDFKDGEVIELNRLWIDDELGMNTESMIMSASWSIMRHSYPEVKVVQSFADGRLGAGTIYKASNFKYYGCESTLFFQDKVTGVISHKVGIENTKSPVSFMKLNKLYCEGRLQQFRVNTYRFIFPLYQKIEVPVLDRNGEPVMEEKKIVMRDSEGKVVMENGRPLFEMGLVPKKKRVPLKIAFKEEPMPEYQRGQNMLEDYVHPIKLLCRAYILARLLEYKEDGVDFAKLFYEYAMNNDNYKDKFEGELKLALRNNTIYYDICRDAESVAGANSEIIAKNRKLLQEELNTFDLRDIAVKKEKIEDRWAAF